MHPFFESYSEPNCGELVKMIVPRVPKRVSAGTSAGAHWMFRSSQRALLARWSKGHSGMRRRSSVAMELSRRDVRALHPTIPLFSSARACLKRILNHTVVFTAWKQVVEEILGKHSNLTLGSIIQQKSRRNGWSVESPSPPPLARIHSPVLDFHLLWTARKSPMDVREWLWRTLVLGRM